MIKTKQESSELNNRREESENRPSTTSYNNRLGRYLHSSAEHNRSNHLSEENRRKIRTANPMKIKTNFLKKGTSINKSIILNVLRSKTNPQTCGSTFSYTNAKGNSKVEEMIGKEIPLGLRDIVGSEEMIRMSHIMTGSQFNNINLTQKINMVFRNKEKKIKENERGA